MQPDSNGRWKLETHVLRSGLALFSISGTLIDLYESSKNLFNWIDREYEFDNSIFYERGFGGPNFISERPNFPQEYDRTHFDKADMEKGVIYHYN